MQKSETSVIDQLIRKLGLHGEEKLKEKTTELLRLLELKSSRTGSAINEYAKTVICIELATTPLGITFDSEIGLKLSGLRKTAYENYKRTFEKILELNKPVGINEICVQLGLHEYQKKATQFLEIYKKQLEGSTDEVDITHPQYAAMAVYQACKTGKGSKTVKSKLVTYSHLKSAQWTKLEQKWDNLLKDHINTGAKPKKKIETNEQEVQNKENKTLNSSEKPKSLDEVDDYETWKQGMLDYAYAKLKKQALAQAK